jgi:aspartyl-tRNA(Asn)/glutamyl-tRNA(Gln) amidotransferase subunit B
MSNSEWETVIGLEVHAELKTRTKMFCSCRNEFGNEPNTNVCPVCLGLPGSLPVLNRQAVELAMRIGNALGCTIAPNVFSRKNYFYPDMPKNYQTSQYDLPINLDGELQLPSGKSVGIERAHLEEDTGKNSHVGGAGRIHGADYSLVDYNRSGVPLIEIVSRPDIRSSEEAREYVSELRAILVTIGASDGKMEEGSLRCDANVSVRKVGDPLGTRCEIKNVNSLRSLGRAIEYEVKRQIELIESGEKVEQQTRHWNENEGRTSFGRVKSDADDYRYFPEPDLVPVDPDPEWRSEVQRNMPELPASRRTRLTELSGMSGDAITTVVDLDLDRLVFGAIDAGADARVALNRAANELAGNIEAAMNMPAESFAKLIKLESSGALTSTQAKQVLVEMVDAGGDPEEIAKARGFEALDAGALTSTVDQVIASHQAEFERFKEGEQKLMGFFTGKVMAATQGKADGKAVAALLRERAGI